MLTQFTPEHIPIFRALLEIKRTRHALHQADHAKKIAWEGDIKQTHGRTLQLLDQLSPEGRVGENHFMKEYVALSDLESMKFQQ